ncbi:RHS repeat domain-containing protein, partial [Leptospira haakeii]|uniref:RHS repeat domain-containing protein n=1 Tax=Leptospira haakeii TaxID=2023198 RepID=UPI001A9D6AF7
KITADDGFSNRIFKTYEYSNGYAFSAFINGKVEKDFFGFGNFTEKDPYGVRKARQYNNIPYSDFMMNRALSGAEKESHLVGTDNQDYGSILRTYDIKKIETSAGITSYMVIPTLQENYIKGIKTKTTGQNLELSGYNLSKKTETNTDLFADSAHPSVSITNITEFETVSLSNQTRTKKSINLAGSSNEVSTSITYDTQGNPIRSVTSYTGSGLGSVAPMITEITYDTLGNQISQKDVSGNPARGTDFVYDTQLKQFVVEKTSFGGSIRLKNLYTIDYTNAFGTPLQATDPNGNKTIYEYDSYARTVKISADTDSGTKVLATYSYDSSFPLSAKSVLISGTWDPDFALREYADGLARTVYKVKTASEGKAVRTGRIVYDGAGRISRSGQADWTDTGNLDHFSLHMEEKNPTVFEYDAIGRVTTATLPLAAGETSPTILTTVYNDPYESIEIHSGGTNKRTVKDARGQTLYVEDSGSDGVVAQIGFCYNLAGNRTKKSDLNDGTPLNCSDISTGVANKDVSGKNQAYWAYDGFGKVKVQSDPDLGLQKFEYNAFGNISKSTDAKNIITTFGYDPLGRMNTKVQPEGTTYLTYDSLSGSQNSLGKLVKVEDQVQTKTFSYDKLGRVKKETRSFKNIPLKNGDVPYITEYEYDLLGRVSKVDYPAHPVNHSRLRACYNYGTAGYISDISVQVNTNGILPGLCNKTVVENITYNEFNQTAGFTLGNGVATNYTYDARQRLVRLQSSGDVDGTTKVLQDAIYTFNSRNNIINIANTASDYTTQYDYEYDGLNRLVNAQGTYFEPTDAYTKQFRQSFDYAKNGNLIAKRSHNFSTGAILDERLYQYDNHQVRRIDSSKYGSDTLSMNYDASGNMIRQRDQVLDLTKQMEYDSENRIVRIRDKDNYTIGTYSYDEGGFRVHKSALVPDGAQYKHQEILYPNKFYGLEYMDDENVLRSINNIYLNGVRIAAITEDGRAAFYLADQVDSVSTVLDDNAHTLSRMQYEPYGDTFVQRGNLAFSPKYNSQELDKESGFYFYNARYYDASIARFVTADTIIDGEFNTQGWNRFSYVKGNPILYKDPTGHEAGWFDNLTSKIKGAFGGKSKLDEYNDKVDSMNSIPKNNNTATNQKEGTGSGKANQILSNPFRIGIKKKEEKSWWNAFSGENDSKNKPDSKSEKKVEEYEEMQLYPDGPIVTFWLPKKVQKAGEYVDAAAGVTQSLENDRFYTEPDGEGNDVMHNEFGSKAAYYYHKNGEDIFKCNPYQTCKVPMEIDTTSKLESVSDKLTNGKQKPATQYNSNNTTTGARQ